MLGEPVPSGVVYQTWKYFADSLREAIAPLTANQLAFRAAPNQRSLGVIVQHLIAGRVYWFHDFMGEGSAEIRPYQAWDHEGQLDRSAPELVGGLEKSWDLIGECIGRWTPADLAHTFPDEQRGQHYELPRAWVIYHVMQHDFLHGGEASLLMGMQGLKAPAMFFG